MGKETTNIKKKLLFIETKMYNFFLRVIEIIGYVYLIINSGK